MALTTAQLEIMRGIDQLHKELVVSRQEEAARLNSSTEALLSNLRAMMADCRSSNDRHGWDLLAEVHARQESLAAAWTGAAAPTIWGGAIDCLMLLLGSRSSLIAVVLIIHGWRLRSFRQRWSIWIVAVLVDPLTTGVWLGWKICRGVRGILAWLLMKIRQSLRGCCCCSPRTPAGPAVPEQPGPPVVAESWGRRMLNFLLGDPNEVDEYAARACVGCVRHCPGSQPSMYRWLWGVVTQLGPVGGAPAQPSPA